MTRYNTGNPLGSTDPRDLYDNAENLDAGINGPGHTWDDRFGQPRASWAGIENRFNQFLADGSTIEFATFADASAAAAGGQIPNNRQVAVIGDTGTHTDPSSGSVVPNSGRYVMTASGLVWRSADVLSQKLDKSVVNNRISEFPHRSNFVAGQIDGPYTADLTTPVNSVTWSITSSGELSIGNFATAQANARFWTVGQQRYSDSATYISTEIILDQLIANSAGPLFAIGNTQAELIGVFFNNSGTLQVVNGNLAVVGSLTATDATMAFTTGDNAAVEATIYADGSGFVVARRPSLNKYLRLDFPAATFPVGKIWIGLRRYNPTRVTSFYVRQFQPSSAKEVQTALDAGSAPFIPGFAPTQVKPLVTATSGAVTTAYSRYLNSQSELILDGSSAATTQGFGIADTGLRYRGIGTFEYVAPLELVTASTGSTGSGLGIVFGDTPGSHVLVALLSNGYFGTFNNNGQAVQGQTYPQLAYAVGQKASIRAVMYEDGTAKVIVTKGSFSRTIELTGVPQGRVALGIRGGNVIKVPRFNAVPIAGSVESRLKALESAPRLPSSPVLLGWSLLPDGEAGRSPKGFTCTGRAIGSPTGIFARCVYHGDDGRLVESDGSPYKPRIHITDRESRALLKTIDPGYTGASLQGVACSMLESDKVWAATSANGAVRKYDAITGGEIVASAFDWNAAGYDGQPNGLTCDDTRGGFWVTPSIGNVMRLISYDPSASPRALDSRTLGVAGTSAGNSPDHLCYIPELDAIAYTLGGNGADGTVRVFFLSSNVDVLWGVLPGAQAIEGITVDMYQSIVETSNDGGYHNIAQPAFNTTMRHQMPSLNG